MTPDEARTLQRELASKVELDDRLSDVRRIAGCDVAYEKDGSRFWAAVCVLDAESLGVVEVARHTGEAPFPYVPGLLSFREMPCLLPCFEKLSELPDLIVCDGNGILHPRRFGIASHLGVVLDRPSIGCAKNLLVGTHGLLAEPRGSHAPIHDGGEKVGAVVRTQSSVKPLFVSSGHRVSHQTAIDWVLRLAPKFRQPETTRAADQEVNRLRRHASG
jgi:deoxyribonuclease V